MPNNPMTAEEFIAHLKRGHPNTVDWHHIGDKYTDEELIEEVKKLIASTLQSAADRMCGACGNCGMIEVIGEYSSTCPDRRAVLDKLNKPDTFEPHENDGQTA